MLLLIKKKIRDAVKRHFKIRYRRNTIIGWKKLRKWSKKQDKEDIQGKGNIHEGKWWRELRNMEEEKMRETTMKNNESMTKNI